MIIKSHVRGGYRAASDYLKDQGQNEKTRVVQISDPDAKNLDEAFHNMWVVACNSKVKKPLHHISINPFRDERLTDEQVLKIIERAEQKCGYKPGDHQRVIVEHIKDGRQHFHVMWNRVSMDTGKAVWPGHHWKKSKQVAREMEKELGLKRPTPRRFKRMFVKNIYAGIAYGQFRRYQKTGFRPYRGGAGRYGSKGYSGKGRYRNSRSGSDLNYRTSKTKISWRISKVGYSSPRHALSPRYYPSSLQSVHALYRGTLPSKSGDTPYSLSLSFCNANSFEKLLFPNQAEWVPFNQHLSLNPSGSSTKIWQLPRSAADSSGAAGSYIAVPIPVQATFGLFWKSLSTWNREERQDFSSPLRPEATSNMSREQLIDLRAAEEGKISWAEYFKKWGRGGGPAP